MMATATAMEKIGARVQRQRTTAMRHRGSGIPNSHKVVTAKDMASHGR